MSENMKTENRRGTEQGRGFCRLFPKLDGAAVITEPGNVCYLTGFYTTARRPGQLGTVCVVMSEQRTLFLCPANWVKEAESQLEDSGVEIIAYGGQCGEIGQVLTAAVKRLAGGADRGYEIGIEQDFLGYDLYRMMAEHLPKARFRDISMELKRARAVKSPDEIRRLRASAALATKTMEYAKTIVRPGIREYELAAELEYFMRKNGSDGTPFTMKALSGENTAVTIQIPGKRKVCRGDLVLFDFGAVVDCYASDWTRTFVCGEASEKQWELYELVREIERQCIGLVRPGTSVHKLMDLAMEIAGGSPVGKYFNPYLGHSIGLSSQEWPALTADTEEVLKENMVITIEPGVYIPGIGGVRIEDEVLVTADGCEVLTGLEKEEYELAERKKEEQK